MPLEHGKSKKAFEHNIKAEVGAGKPLKQSLAIAYATKRKAQHKAHGGEADMCAHGGPEHCMEGCYAEGGGVNGDQPISAVFEHESPTAQAMAGDDDNSSGARMAAEGGDIVERIMKAHKHMSEGGKVANDTEITAGFEPDEFDDLAHRDDLEFAYTGANSGDELDNEAEDKDRMDPIARVMMKRRKQHNPRPA